ESLAEIRFRSCRFSSSVSRDTRAVAKAKSSPSLLVSGSAAHSAARFLELAVFLEDFEGCSVPLWPTFSKPLLRQGFLHGRAVRLQGRRQDRRSRSGRAV